MNSLYEQDEKIKKLCTKIIWYDLEEYHTKDDRIIAEPASHEPENQNTAVIVYLMEDYFATTELCLNCIQKFIADSGIKDSVYLHIFKSPDKTKTGFLVVPEIFVPLKLIGYP